MRVYKKKTIRRMKWYGVILVLSGIPLGIGMGRSLEEGRTFLLEESQTYAQKLYLPLFSYQKEQESEREEIFWLPLHVWMPLAGYLEDQTEKRGKEEPAEVLEDEETIAWILQCQANDEHAVDEEGKLVGAEPETQESAVEQPVPGMDLSIERLRDFEYLTSNLYTIDSSTMIGPEQLNVDDLLNRSMKIDQSTGGPKILIFHTHSQEEFADSIPGDPSTSIVGVGEYLTQLLNADGIETLHDSGVYDIINGKLDRSRAYENAESAVRPVLEANPTIEVAIDLHRDGVPDERHLVTQVNGKPTAQLLFYNGLSYTVSQGAVSYLPNPYIEENLAFSFQLEYQAAQYYPDLYRGIYLAGLRYNLHLKPRALLLEAGAQTNTVEEVRNAMEPFADILNRVLKGSDKEG